LEFIRWQKPTQLVDQTPVECALRVESFAAEREPGGSLPADAPRQGDGSPGAQHQTHLDLAHGE